MCDESLIRALGTIPRDHRKDDVNNVSHEVLAVSGSSLSRLIYKRRSVRQFLKRPIKKSTLESILDAGRWAPSGLNNQPWRFVVVRNPSIKKEIARCTTYAFTIQRSDCVILVYLDKRHSYHFLKDAQAIGACIQNMLLRAFELRIGSCWMGEILNKKTNVNAQLGIGSRYELMAAIALGYPRKTPSSKRIALKRLILKEYQ